MRGYLAMYGFDPQPITIGLLIAASISAVLWKYAELKERKKSQETIKKLWEKIAQLEAELLEAKK